ncbi:hypothetical protein L195_g036818, partial [Trifolium pratense]
AVIKNKTLCSLAVCLGDLIVLVWLIAISLGPRIQIPRSLRWAACGAVTVSSSTALLVRLFSPECEPQNIAAYDNKK